MLDETKRKQWNDVYRKFSGDRHSVWRESATPFFANSIDYLKDRDVTTVLDAGCGDGRNLTVFAEADFEVTGVDVSDLALRRCRELVGNSPNVTLIRDSLEELSSPPASFDAVLCDFVLVHVEEVEKVLAGFHKVLKKDGYVLLEFISTKDERCNYGERLGPNQYLQHGIFIRTFDVKNIERLLSDFTILSIEAKSYSDPSHGGGYHRKERHTHHSYFVIAQK